VERKGKRKKRKKKPKYEKVATSISCPSPICKPKSEEGDDALKQELWNHQHEGKGTRTGLLNWLTRELSEDERKMNTKNHHLQYGRERK